MGIAHEMLSHSEGQTSYRVRVFSFKQKMKNWKPGRVIHLKTFKVDGIKLRLDIYPNGNTSEEEDNVSIYIRNNSDVDIDILFDIQMGIKEIHNDEKMHLGAGASRGWPEFYSHRRDYYDDDDDDEEFEITVTVKKLWKQVHGDCVFNNVSDNVQSVQKRLENVEKSLAKLDKLGNLEKSVKSLIEKSEGVVATIQRPQIPYPECPICFNNMIQNTRIMQCSAGHLICGGCYDKLNPKICPTCKKGIIGRCHGMESYLRTLFPSN